MIKKLSIMALILSSLTSCVSVKEYEMVNLNDPDMRLASKKSNRFETSYQSYREASAGANGGKSGGGCGCN